MTTQEIIEVIKGLSVLELNDLVKAIEEKFEVYNQVYKQVIAEEFHRPDLPIITNVNFGHAEPIGIIPYGLQCELDVEQRTITILEPMTR